MADLFRVSYSYLRRAFHVKLKPNGVAPYRLG
jgi:hypothetical protein